MDVGIFIIIRRLGLKMSLQLKHRGLVNHDGELKFYNIPMWQQQKLNLRGKEFQLVITEVKRKPSKDLFGYFFGGILQEAYQYETFSHMDSAEDIHYDIYAPRFLKHTKLVRFKNETWEKQDVRRLSDLEEPEMAHYVKRVKIALLAEEGIKVRTPEEYYSSLYQTPPKKTENGEF